MPFELFLALRYLVARRKQAFLSVGGLAVALQFAHKAAEGRIER